MTLRQQFLGAVIHSLIATLNEAKGPTLKPANP